MEGEEMEEMEEQMMDGEGEEEAFVELDEEELR